MSSIPLYGHCLSTNRLLYLSHKNYYVLRVDTVPCSNNERFQQVINMILLKSNPPVERTVFDYVMYNERLETFECFHGAVRGITAW